jgi:hypothetical protein
VNIEETGRDEVMRPIIEDSDTQEVVDAVAQDKALRAFLMSAIRDFQDRQALSDRTPNLRKLANNYAGSKGQRNAVGRICGAIESLYGRFDPSHVRGALLEALVQRAIQTRYGGGADWLENNIEFKVEEDDDVRETTTSVDVLGVDVAADLGECHDCKVRARKVDPKWLEELQDDFTQFGFRIGVATADSARVARRDLKRGGKLSAATAVITHDNWVLPLQP